MRAAACGQKEYVTREATTYFIHKTLIERRLRRVPAIGSRRCEKLVC